MGSPFWRRAVGFFRPIEDSVYDAQLINETRRDRIVRAVMLIVVLNVTWTVVGGFRLHVQTVAEGFGLSCLAALVVFLMRRRERRELLAWRRDARDQGAEAARARDSGT